MTITIALAGKGGVGKTTLAALTIKYLVDLQQGPILAIDADPSSNLNLALGLDLDWTVGDIREDLLGQVRRSLTAGGAAMGTLPGGITKRDYLDYQIRSSLAESKAFDLIAMGRAEGSGCYCAVNHNLREVLDAISKNYRYVVIDNEAGMEHLSRRTTRDLQHLLVVSDPTLRGLSAARRIAAFRHELDIHIDKTYLVINRLSGELPQPLVDQVASFDIPLLAMVPAASDLADYEISGKSLVEMKSDSPMYRAVAGMLEQILAD
jgi:CO dehydrogenase maturation factor